MAVPIVVCARWADPAPNATSKAVNPYTSKCTYMTDRPTLMHTLEPLGDMRRNAELKV